MMNGRNDVGQYRAGLPRVPIPLVAWKRYT